MINKDRYQKGMLLVGGGYPVEAGSDTSRPFQNLPSAGDYTQAEHAVREIGALVKDAKLAKQRRKFEDDLYL